MSNAATIPRMTFALMCIRIQTPWKIAAYDLWMAMEDAERLRHLAEIAREDRERMRESAEAARRAGEDARVEADAARHDAMEAVHITAETLKVTLEHMKTLEDMRRKRDPL
jgi:hypothetical protein